MNPQQVGRAGEVFVAAEITGGEARRSRSPATCQGSTSSPAISTAATGCGTQTQDGSLITPPARPDRAYAACECIRSGPCMKIRFRETLKSSHGNRLLGCPYRWRSTLSFMEDALALT